MKLEDHFKKVFKGPYYLLTDTPAFCTPKYLQSTSKCVQKWTLSELLTRSHRFLDFDTPLVQNCNCLGFSVSEIH